MFCPNCGMNITDTNQQFCPKCGSPTGQKQQPQQNPFRNAEFPGGRPQNGPGSAPGDGWSPKQPYPFNNNMPGGNPGSQPVPQMAQQFSAPPPKRRSAAAMIVPVFIGLLLIGGGILGFSVINRSSVPADNAAATVRETEAPAETEPPVTTTTRSTEDAAAATTTTERPTTTTTTTTTPRTTTTTTTTTRRTTTTTTTAPPEIDKLIERTSVYEIPNGLTITEQVSIPESHYKACRTAKRYRQSDEYIYYLTEPNNDEILGKVAASLKKLAEDTGLSEKDLLYMVIRYVQSMEYITDKEGTGKEDYPKFPIETMIDQNGDCEDLSILLVGLLRKLGYKVAFIELPEHCAVGINVSGSSTGEFYRSGSVRYYYIETTDFGWNIGEVPDQLKNKDGSAYATIIPVN